MSFALKDKKLLVGSIAIITLLTLVITLILNSFLINDTIEEKSKKYYHTYVDNQYIKISDTYDSKGSSFTEALKKEGFLTRLKQFNHDLQTTDGLNFFEITKQHVAYWGYYNGKNNFVVAYDMDPTMKNRLIKTPAGQVYITPLYAIQVDSKAYNLFLKNILAAGEDFSDDAYNYQPDKTTIPCILGSNYSTVYEIGDLIQIEYLTKIINLEVSGFFDKTASIPINGSILYLDNYIILPSLNCQYDPQDPEEEFFQKILYDQKNSGYLIDEGLDYYAIVHSIANTYDLKYTVGTNKKDVSMVNQGVTALLTKKIVFIISIFLLLLAIFTLILVLMQKFHREAKKISINLICGASLSIIKVKMYSYVIFCYLISLIMALLIIGRDFFYISSENMAMGFTIIFFSLIAAIFTLNLLVNNYHLGNALRRR
ncbi:MAG: hypothetical protein VR72_03440 [Clostridiaceae bacterium BRH_c20a]|nr:MAG: hypothetical protein VR72_03440 [Clostridiaceae bacterium BRH_c20a]